MYKETIVLPGVEEMSDYLAGKIGKKISDAGEGISLNIALSGGSTPKLIFENIVIRHKKNMKWDRIRFFQVDERCVPPDAAESNYRLIQHHLLIGLKVPADHFFRIRGEEVPQEEASRYTKIMVENLPMAGKWPVFDMVLLGLGKDGHTASLFPGDTHVLKSRNCCEVAVHPQTGQKRITLTLPVLNNSRELVFMVTGQSKRDIVAEIILNQGKKRQPASLVNPGNGTLTWLLDTDAASKIRFG